MKLKSILKSAACAAVIAVPAIAKDKPVTLRI